MTDVDLNKGIKWRRIFVAPLFKRNNLKARYAISSIYNNHRSPKNYIVGIPILDAKKIKYPKCHELRSCVHHCHYSV